MAQDYDATNLLRLARWAWSKERDSFGSYKLAQLTRRYTQKLADKLGISYDDALKIVLDPKAELS
jgi:hypothetical protein